MSRSIKPNSQQAMTNEQLMLAFQSGDQESLGQLYENLCGSLVKFATSKISTGRSGRRQLAQDAVQNAFTKVMANVNGKGAWKPGLAKVDGWMRMIVGQQVIELSRKKSSSEKVCSDFGTPERPCYSVEQLASLPNRITHDFDAIVDQITKRLPHDLKMIVQLLLKGFTRREIADELGISEPTVCRRRYAAQRYFEDFDFGLAA